ncbi:MAG TPA: tripartite tricarboxylate transporter substrate binding protein [Desulfobacterales bacterium]|nr:tripartite tricarboxylate transporter substrate binding protein [Desulfobacterales bacterium]
MKWKNLFSVVAVLLVALCLTPLASGAGYPAKEINYIVAFNPGGESDIEFRIMQPFLEKAFGVRFTPEYKPAAGGALAWSFLSAATPDGYVIGGFNAPHISIQPLAMNDVTYKTDGFTYLCMIENTPVALCVKKDFPANTLKELIDYAKANPGKVTAGGVGKNSGPHLAALQFQKLAGVKFTYIPFQGTGQLKPAIMGGHVDVVFTNSPAAVEMLPLGIKTLAVGTEKRMMQLPDVPTFAEAGIKYYPRIDRGIFAPKGLPKDVYDTLDKKLFAIVSSKEVQDKLIEGGFVPNPMNGEAAAKYIKELTEDIKKLLEEEKLMPTK